MESTCELYADPVCPFGWITSRWLREIESMSLAHVVLHPMSLHVLNEGRELEEWYREFNDRSWVPAQVAAATVALGRYEDFYEAFGQHIHVDREGDWDQALRDSLGECSLPHDLPTAAPADPANEAMLRLTSKTLDTLVGLESGTPTLVINGRAMFGPVLRAIPRGDDAQLLWEALQALVRVPAFTEVRRGDDRPLQRT